MPDPVRLTDDTVQVAGRDNNGNTFEARVDP